MADRVDLRPAGPGWGEATDGRRHATAPHHDYGGVHDPVPQDLRYTRDHEWVRSLGDDRMAVGITDFAQRQLGDIVFVELPSIGERCEAGQPFGSVESVKSVTEIYMPVTGAVAAVNEVLAESPEDVNTDPYGDGWMVEIRLAEGQDLSELLTAGQYEEYLQEEDSD